MSREPNARARASLDRQRYRVPIALALVLASGCAVNQLRFDDVTATDAELDAPALDVTPAPDAAIGCDGTAAPCADASPRVNSAPVCANGMVACDGGACTDLNNDYTNCGACGRVCPFNVTACRQGACGYPACTQPCASPDHCYASGPGTGGCCHVESSCNTSNRGTGTCVSSTYSCRVLGTTAYCCR